MSIPVVHEPHDLGPPHEHCALCGRPTKTWYEPYDVAVCYNCAKWYEPKDVPTKEQWFASAKERM